MKRNKKAMAIINPVSSNGRTGRRWPEISALLQKSDLVFDYRFTQASGDARNIARESLEEGYETLISIGGDGTLNEIVNGFFLVSEEIRDRSALGIISMGTGGDFIRTAGIPKNVAEAVLKIAEGKTFLMDIALSRFIDNNGQKTSRYFCNTVDIGLGGDTAARVNRSNKALGGFISFLYSVIITLILYKNKEVTIVLNDKGVITGKTAILAVTNGKYFGGGMKIAPLAELDDGLLDIVFAPDLSKLKLFSSIPSIYRGTHLAIKDLQYFRGKKITITSPEKILIEMDGETPGWTPLEVEIIPRALKIII